MHLSVCIEAPIYPCILSGDYVQGSIHEADFIMTWHDSYISVCFCVYCTKGDEGYINRDEMYLLLKSALVHVGIHNI